MHLGDKIKQLRQEREWHQPELAEKLGIEQSYLSKLENGKSLPSKEVFERLLQVFDQPLCELLSGIEEKYLHKEMRVIPQVAQFLKLQVKQNSKNKQRWFLAASASCVLGISLVMSGFLLMTFPDKRYEYVSAEIVPLGQAGEIFISKNAYIEYAASHNALQQAESQNDLETMMQQWEFERQRIYMQTVGLETDKRLLLGKQRGSLFSEKIINNEELARLEAAGYTQGGSRTYELAGVISEENAWFRLLYIVGVFLLTLGMFGFIAEKRIF